MYEDSFYTLSEIEETPASVLVKGLIDQSQIERSWEDQSKETEDKVSNARERQLTFKGKSYKTDILHRNRATQYTVYQRKSRKHITSWIRMLILENLKGKEMSWIHKKNSSMKHTRPTMISWNHLMTQTHLITGLTHVIVNTNSVE